MIKRNIGSSFDSWLREEQIYRETASIAIKRVLARKVSAVFQGQRASKAEMAKRMHIRQKSSTAMGQEHRIKLG